MKYVIMCGNADYEEDWPDTPRHLCVVDGEVILERTIRLLKENGVTDITITSNDKRFANFGVKFLEHNVSGTWCNGFYNFEEPACYIFGDVYYSQTAIATIVNTKTDDIQFFASNRPTMKRWAEPYGFKVVNYKKFFISVYKTKELFESEQIERCSSWELWQVIKDTELEKIDYSNYIAINDYSCDIDFPKESRMFESKLCKERIMIHAVPSRMDYVKNYLIPSLEEQKINRITVWNDENLTGNLTAFVKSCESLPYDDNATWHLQDDVLICRYFSRMISGINGEIICGFSSVYDKSEEGIVKPVDMWYSFPCIKIPNKIARDFAAWIQDDSIEKEVNLKRYIRWNKYDDTLFKEYMMLTHPDMDILNLNPNLVTHIDWLIGGSIANEKRSKARKIVTSTRFEDEYLVEILKNKLGYVEED